MMARQFGILMTFVSALFFPWTLTALMAVCMALFEPWVPFSVGLFVDVLYYAPQAGSLPTYTLYGAIVTTVMFFVRSRLKTSIIGE